VEHVEEARFMEVGGVVATAAIAEIKRHPKMRGSKSLII